MITEICEHLHNRFDRDRSGNYFHKEEGTYTITDGSISLSFLVPGQYYGIAGSTFNDGIHRYGDEGVTEALTDETFTGTVWAMKVPPAFLALCAEIEAWQTDNGTAAAGLYQSESFSGYSYSKAASSTGGALSWQTQFRSRLNAYRKI